MLQQLLLLIVFGPIIRLPANLSSSSKVGSSQKQQFPAALPMKHLHLPEILDTSQALEEMCTGLLVPSVLVSYFHMRGGGGGGLSAAHLQLQQQITDNAPRILYRFYSRGTWG
jgi:hypothetical protein